METTRRRNKGELGKRKLGKYMTTWTSPDGNRRRQIDYIMINAKRRNMARTAQSNIYWRGNMNQNHRHRVKTMKRYYNTAKKYKQPIPADTGTRLKCDIKELRIHPGKLTKAFSRTRTRSQGATGNKSRLGRMGRLSENTWGTARENISNQRKIDDGKRTRMDTKA